MKQFLILIASYIRRHGTMLIALTLTFIVFATVFSLYCLPLEPVLYAAVLSAVIFLVLGLVRFASFSRRHRALIQLQKKLENELTELPRPQSVIEDDYQELIRVLHKSRVDLLSAADRTISEMTDYYTLWAHQIKTPIAALRLITEESGDPRMAAELFRIEQYVDMVLTYVRAESVETDSVLRLQPVDPIIRAAVRKYARMFITKKLSLNYNGAALQAVTDEKWLQFVLEQLLSNAVKYTRTGGVRIYAEGRLLIIEDTGIGIAPEDLPRVCEKGYTGYTGRADKRSTGIGLYLCRRILTKLGHTIRLESSPGHGTRVILGLEGKPLEHAD